MTQHALTRLHLARPLQGGGSYFLFTLLLVFMVAVPAWLLAPGVTKTTALTFAEATADVYLLAWLLAWLPRRIRHAAQGAATGLLLVCSVADCFVKVHFHSFISPAMLRLLLETRPDEAASFATTYLLSARTVAVLLPFAGWGLLWWAYCRHGHRWRQQLSARLRQGARRAVGAVVVVGLLTSIGSRLTTADVLSQSRLSDLEVRYGDTARLSLYSSAHRVLFALRTHQLTARQITKLRRLHRTLHATRTDSVGRVVLIIGESFNRSHSQLYGYPLPTTPAQQRRAARGEITVFTDAVSCWNLTSYVFQHILSLYSVDSPRPWEDYPLLPAVFRRAGYRTLFLTNQFPPRAAGSVSDFAGSFFLNDPEISTQLFSARNTYVDLHPDDARLVAQYDSLHTGCPLEFTIFSLIGQHFNYDDRYPADGWARFSATDYPRRSELNQAERTVLAHYDNATRYNDAVIDAILRRLEAEDALVVYCPDHGEELFDGTGVSGRTYPARLSHAEMHNQFDIPLWIWTSREFRRRRPALMQRLDCARTRPFMTDDLPHLLLQLAGIRCDGYDERRSPVSTRYNDRRPRLLRAAEPYRP